MIYSYHPTYWKHFTRIARNNAADPWFKKFVEFDFLGKTQNPLFWAGRFITNHVPVDRTGRLNVLNVNFAPIPEVDNMFNKSFSQVCYETASNYWEQYNDISVLWSGGLDSTGVAVALLETKPDNKRLTIIGTAESIDEYPDFYEKHKSICVIDDPIKFWSRLSTVSTDTHYVSGDIGDQLFGGVIDEFGDKRFLPWEDFIYWPDTFSQSQMQHQKYQREWTISEKKKFLDDMTAFNSAAPFPIKTIFDFVWWLTFSTRVNGAKQNLTVLATELNKNKIAVLDTVSTFYFNHDFQQWSMLNHHLKYPGDVTTYKQPIKDLIISYNNDVDFLTKKIKVKSTPKILGDQDWFSNWIKNSEANYVIMNDGTTYNSQNDIPFEVMKEVLKI